MGSLLKANVELIVELSSLLLYVFVAAFMNQNSMIMIFLVLEGQFCSIT